MITEPRWDLGRRRRYACVARYVPFMFNSCAVLTSKHCDERKGKEFNNKVAPPRFDIQFLELLTRTSACPKLSLTACSSFWMSASDVMSMLTTRTLILVFTLRISALVASSFAMLRLARTIFDAEALANSSAIAWVQDHC